jgi:hypothetical protein
MSEAGTLLPSNDVRFRAAGEVLLTMAKRVPDSERRECGASTVASARASWLHGATIDLDGGEVPVL